MVTLVLSSSCAYEEKRKLETTLEQNVNRFHEQLNNREFHEIYTSSDASLQQRTNEAEFTEQLKSAGDQLGHISGNALVIISDKAWRDMRLSKAFGNRRQSFNHVAFPASDLIVADEKFGWFITDDQPKLASYQFRFVCRKPCNVGFGIGPP